MQLRLQVRAEPCLPVDHFGFLLGARDHEAPPVEVLGEDLDLTAPYDALNDSDGAQTVLLEVMKLDEALQTVDVAPFLFLKTGRAGAHDRGRHSLLFTAFVLRPHLPEQRHQRLLQARDLKNSLQLPEVEDSFERVKVLPTLAKLFQS